MLSWRELDLAYLEYKDKRRPDSSSSAIHLSLLLMTQSNVVAREPEIRVEAINYSENAERVNGQLAMIGFVAALGAYIVTGQIIPGIF